MVENRHEKATHKNIKIDSLKSWISKEEYKFVFFLFADNCLINSVYNVSCDIESFKNQLLCPIVILMESDQIII